MCSPSAIADTALWNSATFWTKSMPLCLKTERFISCWITTPPTRHALVRSWLAKRPRYHLHFTPTHSSWINQVERWFAQLSQKQIKRGNPHSVQQLQEAIETFVKDHNASPKPFRWVKSADQILASITRFARSAVLKEINDSGH